MFQNDPRWKQIQHHEEQILHYQGEWEKLKRWRDRRMATLRGQAERAAATRPTTIHDAESILWAWSSADPKLKEFGAGLEIVERRMAMHAAVATNLRTQIADDTRDAAHYRCTQPN